MILFIVWYHENLVAIVRLTLREVDGSIANIFSLFNDLLNRFGGVISLSSELFWGQRIGREIKINIFLFISLDSLFAE